MKLVSRVLRYEYMIRYPLLYTLNFKQNQIMLKKHLLAHRKGSTHYSNLNTPTEMKNVYIGAIYYFKNNTVSKIGPQLESLSTAWRKAKKMSKKWVGEKMAFLLACMHQKFKLFLAWERYFLFSLLSACCHPHLFSSTTGSTNNKLAANDIWDST